MKKEKIIRSIDQEFSFFRLSLIKHLQEIHSEKLQDKKFIIQRCEEAENTYEIYINQGVSPYMATEAATNALLKDLNFSLNQIIKNVFEKEFSDISDEKQEQFINQILTDCQKVFEQYEISDLSPESANYEKLYTEITGCIVTYLEAHEL